MRAAVIFGLGSDEKDLRPFQKNSPADWLIGMPARASEADAILIFGGDGTVHRHLGQLVKLQLPVLVVPCGSGNDFARALGLRSARDSLQAWRRFSSGSGHARSLDLGIIKCLTRDEPQGLKPLSKEQADRSAVCRPYGTDSVSDSTQGLRPGLNSGAPSELNGGNPLTACDEHYFCCVGGVGLDGEVTRRANQLPRWLRGHGGYAVSLPSALLKFAPLPMTISLPSGDNPDAFVAHCAKPTVLAAFANTPTYGGGMKIAPRAQMDDGKLDVCVISDIDKFKLFCLFPSVYFGRHLGLEEIEYLQTDRLRIDTENPLAVYADGEYVCETPIEVRVTPRALRVIVQ